jgi:hypothetical protein
MTSLLSASRDCGIAEFVVPEAELLRLAKGEAAAAGYLQVIA